MNNFMLGEDDPEYISYARMYGLKKTSSKDTQRSRQPLTEDELNRRKKLNKRVR